MDDRVVTLEIMAGRIGVSKRWLRDEAESGRLPHIKADRTILFHPETVERILVERARRDEQQSGVGGAA